MSQTAKVHIPPQRHFGFVGVPGLTFSAPFMCPRHGLPSVTITGIPADLGSIHDHPTLTRYEFANMVYVDGETLSGEEAPEGSISLGRVTVGGGPFNFDLALYLVSHRDLVGQEREEYIKQHDEDETVLALAEVITALEAYIGEQGTEELVRQAASDMPLPRN